MAVTAAGAGATVCFCLDTLVISTFIKSARLKEVKSSLPSVVMTGSSPPKTGWAQASKNAIAAAIVQVVLTRRKVVSAMESLHNCGQSAASPGCSGWDVCNNRPEQGRSQETLA